jgi:hypothetical protein
MKIYHLATLRTSQKSIFLQPILVLQESFNPFVFIGIKSLIFSGASRQSRFAFWEGSPVFCSPSLLQGCQIAKFG